MKIELRKPETEIRTTIEFSEEQVIKALELYIKKQGYTLTDSIIKKHVYFSDNLSHEKTIILVLYTELGIQPKVAEAIRKNERHEKS